MPNPRAIAACFALLLTGLASPFVAAQNCDPWVGRLVSLEGRVEVKRDDGGRWHPVSLGQTYCFGDRLRVGSDSRASIELNNDTILRLDQNSTLILPEASRTELTFVDLIRGALHLISRVKGELEIRTPFVNAGLEGTEFVVRVLETETLVAVIEGEVEVSNAFGSLRLSGGESASGSKTSAPVLRLDLKPEDAVQWAIYYPAIADPAKPELAEDLLSAQRLLQVGRVDEASQALEAVLERNPDNSDALALAAVIELAQNRKVKAQSLARRAVAADASAAALTALSYVQQADFELAAALASAKAATQRSPEQALLWARLAELQAAVGDRRQALASAQRAVELNPGLSRTQTVLGFAGLAGADRSAARAAFEHAIRLDSADPLARIGLGLVKIRDGELADGRREMEVAVSLDPSNALVRSYLGKAYLDEDRYAEAATELDLAKRLDPRDPTPWLYSALLNSTGGRHIQAFEDLQASIARNDFRAVYRSRLLLDQDLAVRSSALGRVYNALGFGRRGLLEGWLSTVADPTSFAAHEFLADTYSALPRHEVAELSERLQAQLLQPQGISAVRPQLSQNELGITGSTLRSTILQRELGAVYAGEGGQFTSSFLVGGNGTEALDIAAAADFGAFSASAGHFYFSTEGFHVNDARKQDITNLLLRSQVTDDTSVLFELRERDVTSGQPNRFFEAAIDPDIQESRNQTIGRVGLRHDHNAAHTSLASITLREEAFSSEFFGFPFVDSNVDEWSAEFRHVWIAPFGVVNFGLAHAETDKISTIPFVQDDATDTSHSTAYLYADVPLSDQVGVTLGLSADHFETETVSESFFFGSSTSRFKRTPINPKLGLLWEPTEAVTVRAGLSRSMTRIVLDAQTIEPTHVAGFNQFYDDPAGTLSQKAGLALDYRLDETTFIGADISRRDLEIPADVAGRIADYDSEEHTGRVYLAKVFSPQVAASVQYLYEDIVRDNDTSRNLDGFERSTIHRVPFDVRYFMANGITASLLTTYVRQKGVFQASAPPILSFDRGRDEFWVTDLTLSKRLPSNQGKITVGVENLFDSQFRFQDTDTARSAFAPERRAFVQLNLSF